jgi:hypothetical protein
MKVVAILETMWDWRGMTSSAGYEEAPRFFRINPENFSGRRLYKLIGPNAKLLVTNACRELVTGPNQHGKPDPKWLADNLWQIEHGPRGATIDVLLVCGKIAQQTWEACDYELQSPNVRVVKMPHPAARYIWTTAEVERMSRVIRGEIDATQTVQ